MTAFASRFGQHVAEVALPHAEAGCRVLLLEECLALFRRHLEGAARVRRVDEAGEGFLAALEELGVVGLDPGLGLRVDRAVVQRLAPVRRALEYREVPRGLGHLGDGLHAGGAGADHRHALACEAHRLVRPRGGMERLALERVDARNARHGRRRERADGRDQEARAVPAAVLQGHLPGAGVVLVVRGSHPALELDVAAQVELVGDVVEIAQRLRLRREMLRPVPFLQQLLGEGVLVGVALGIEARAGIAVPVPGAADTRAGLEHAHAHAELPQAVELVHARYAGTDDDGVVVQTRRLGASLGFSRGSHICSSMSMRRVGPVCWRQRYQWNRPSCKGRIDAET